eukprot:378616-Pleurochrysis_carterae.AAC.1
MAASAAANQPWILSAYTPSRKSWCMAMSPHGGIAASGRPSRVPARSLGRGLRAFVRARLPPFA